MKDDKLFKKMMKNMEGITEDNAFEKGFEYAFNLAINCAYELGRESAFEEIESRKFDTIKEAPTEITLANLAE